MAYRLLEFRCGADASQGYVLQGTDEHAGTVEPITVEDMYHFARGDGALARFLDFRFLRAHRERISAASSED